MKKQNIAIIGLGHVADFQIKALLLSEDFHLAAACDIDPEKRTKLPKNVRFYTDSQDLLQNAEVDAVLISTPNDQHFPVARQFLLARKAVLLEKPATPTLEEFDELAVLSHSNECLLVIAFHAAFARDLQWFQEAYSSRLLTELGPLTGFDCGFYDPYIKDGNLQAGAIRLGGSWTDSGINALSVIGQLIDPEMLIEEDSVLTIVPQLLCREIQGRTTFRFPIKDQSFQGRGTIDTNWTLGLNCKVTRLYFGLTNQEVILHHSKETVLRRIIGQAPEIFVNLANEYPRLVNHYIGVFAGFATHLANRTDNLKHARRLHQLHLTPYTDIEGPVLCR